MHRLLKTKVTALALLSGALPLMAQDSSRVRDSLPKQVGERVDPSDSARRLTRIIVRAAKPQAGYAARRTHSATKSDLPLRDVPQAVTVITSELLADQSAQSMADVVRYIPGITMGQGEGHRDAPTIRGNGSTADFFVDGVRDDAQYMRDLYNVERVEALKGSNAMVFGRGGGGGVLNRVTKEAQWTPRHAVGYETGSFHHNRATVDIGEALSGSLAARVTGMLESSRDFRDATELAREGINPTVAVLAGGTLMRFGYERFADRRTVNRGMPSFNGRPSDAGITTFFGNPDLSRSRVSVHSAGATIERGSLDRVMIRNRSLFAIYDKYYQNVFPGAVNPAGTEVSLSAYNNTIDRRNLFNQTDLTFALGRGRFRQLFLVGAELGRQTTDSYRSTGYFAGNTTTLNVPFDRPTVSAPVTFRQSASDADHRMIAGISAAYAQEQVAFGSHWQAVAGLRVERFEVLFHDNRNGQELFRADRMLSPRYGLVFKPVEAMSFYGSHSVSFLPSAGDQFGSLSPTTRTLAPERFTNHELGAKWDLLSGLSLTGAIYWLNRSNSAAPNPVDPGKTVQTGRQRTTGAEAGISGTITDRWEVSGGYAWQHATIVSQTASARAGATVPLVPYYTLSLWNRYRVVPWLAAGVGVIRQDEMYAAVDNAVTLPAFTRVDAALFASPHPRLRAQVNIENLLNARYYPTSHGNNNILPGAPRTLRVSLTATP